MGSAIEVYSSYNHINYTMYLTIMISDMLSLEDDFPDDDFTDNVFQANFLHSLAVIQGHKDTKTSGETTRFSTNIAAVKRLELKASSSFFEINFPSTY